MGKKEYKMIQSEQARVLEDGRIESYVTLEELPEASSPPNHRVSIDGVEYAVDQSLFSKAKEESLADKFEDWFEKYPFDYEHLEGIATTHFKERFEKAMNSQIVYTDATSVMKLLEQVRKALFQDQ